MTAGAILPRFSLVAVVTLFGALLWLGLPRLGNVPWVWDNLEFVDYAQVLGTQHRIPGKGNYEYSLPPGQPAVAALARGVAKAIGPVDVRVLPELPRVVRVLGWIAGALAGAWLLLAGRRRAGATLVATTTALAALDVVSSATSVHWVAFVLPDLASILLLVPVTGLLAREAWPDRPWAPALAAFGACLLPLVYRIGLVVHPDPLFALFANTALLVTLRARRLGWTPVRGAEAGVLLAAAALTRQSAVLVIAVVLATVVALGRRRSLRFLAAAGAAIVVLAGPWWGYQGQRYGNPIQSNLYRPGVMLSHEPLGFFVDLPREIVTDPWRVLTKNELFPKFHVALWSDWSGIGDFGGPHGARARALAISQSVLGFGGDLLVLGGLLAVGLPALVRTVRRGAETAGEAGLATLTLLFVGAWVAYVSMLLRFPQRDGDPNSPHYLLFLAPAAALLGLEAARRLWRRGGARRVLVGAWAAAYAVSWALVLDLMI